MTSPQTPAKPTLPELVAEQILTQTAQFEAWANFQFSEDISERVHQLNDKKSGGHLTPEEEELNLFLHLSQVTTMIKNKARLELFKKPLHDLT